MHSKVIRSKKVKIYR